MSPVHPSAPNPSPTPTAPQESSWFGPAGWTVRGDDGKLTRPDLAGGYGPPPNIPDYEILGELGRGGMGVVYRARHRKLNRLVALKVLLGGGDAAQVARFRLEAEAVARLAHPTIVQIHDVGEHEGRLYLALEYVEGGTLADALRRRPCEPRAAARLVADLAHGIHAAHQAGIIHRDLKPANILLAVSRDAERSGTSDEALLFESRLTGAVAKITDFGLAKRLEDNSHLTQSGVIVGTPSYMAPEQAAGKPNAISTLVDVYGLGAILFECLTGRPPFQADTPMETVLQVLQEPAPSPRALNPTVDKDLALVCQKCLAKDPKERYGSADALAKDLERWLGGETISAHAPTLGSVLRSWLRQNFGAAGWTVPIGIGYGLLIALLFWFFGKSGMLAAMPPVYAELPSIKPSWLVHVRLPDRNLYPLVFLVLFSMLASVGYVAARLIRPRNGQADLAVGLVTGAIASLFFSVSAGSWFVDERVTVPMADHHLALFRTSTLTYPQERLTEPATLAKLEEAREAFLRRFPDFRKIAPEERTRVWFFYVNGEMTTAGPHALFLGLLFSFVSGVTFCTAGVMIGGLAVRRHPGFWRSLLAYLELTLPAAFLFGELVTQYIGWYSTRVRPRGQLEAYLLLVAMTAAIIAAVYRWNGWIRLALFLFWLGAFIATGILGFRVTP